MTAALIVVIAVLAVALATVLARDRSRRGPASHGVTPDVRPVDDAPAAAATRLPAVAPGDCRRILFPFVASALSARALDAALRLARAEHATLVPVFLARVPMHLPLQAPLPRQSQAAVALQEAIEQRAAGFGVPVDARIERGRDNRHALREAITTERYDRIVIAAAVNGCGGFSPDDAAWLLDNASGEIIVLRPREPHQLPAPGSPAAASRVPAAAVR
jgi:hypothetical protein